MRLTRRSLPALALIVSPLLVVVAGMGPVAAIGLVAAVLLWQWAVVLLALVNPPTGPELRLETIPASHFVEKVRWCLDRLGVSYREIPDMGALGVFVTGRTVPRLLVRTGAVTSVIGNSPEIMRYLWGRYGLSADGRADFLRPSEASVALEARLDRYGVDLQRWIYFHMLPHRRLTLLAWGSGDPRVPVWQRATASILYPLLRGLMRRAFRLSETAHGRVVVRIEALLSDMESRLSDGRESILGGGGLSFADITLASLTGLWLQPPAYGAGRADKTRIHVELMPAPMAADIHRWRTEYPRLVSFVERLYENERFGAGPDTDAGSAGAASPRGPAAEES
jgi:glutathione S-transferase